MTITIGSLWAEIIPASNLNYAIVATASQAETFARKMILPSGKAKTHAMMRVLKRSALITEFMFINDRLSAFLTQHEGEMALVQRSQAIFADLFALAAANKKPGLNETASIVWCLSRAG